MDIDKLVWSFPDQGGKEGVPEPRKGHVAALYKTKLLVCNKLALLVIMFAWYCTLL